MTDPEVRKVAEKIVTYLRAQTYPSNPALIHAQMAELLTRELGEFRKAVLREARKRICRLPPPYVNRQAREGRDEIHQRPYRR